MSLDPRHTAALAYMAAKLRAVLAGTNRQNALDAREAHHADPASLAWNPARHRHAVELEDALAKAKVAEIEATEKARDAAVVLADACLIDLGSGR